MKKEELEQLYVVERKSYDEIALHFGISTSSIYRWIKKYDLPLQMHNVQDLKDQVFGKLLVVNYISSGRYQYVDVNTGKQINAGKYDVWRCKCLTCGGFVNAKSGNLKSGKAGCRKCNSEACSKKLTKCPIDYEVWYNIVKRCNKKGIELNVDPDYLYGLFVKQNAKCALSGIDIYFGKNRTSEGTASPDRIDSNQGYIKGNVRWVHKYVNTMRNAQPDHLFIDWCKQIVNHNSV
jgi:hypothetical protein